jgi:hypothetical protein
VWLINRNGPQIHAVLLIHIFKNKIKQKHLSSRKGGHTRTWRLLHMSEISFHGQKSAGGGRNNTS